MIAISEPRSVLRAQVGLAYSLAEMAHLIKAANQLAPFDLQVNAEVIRIDCCSMVNSRWRCSFAFRRPPGRPTNWTLHEIEYDSRLTIHHALTALGQLEEVGFLHLKHGL